MGAGAGDCQRTSVALEARAVARALAVDSPSLVPILDTKYAVPASSSRPAGFESKYVSLKLKALTGFDPPGQRGQHIW